MAQDKLTQAQAKDVKEILKREIRNELENEVRKEVIRQLKGKAAKDEIKEVTTQVLINLFRVLWNRSSMWEKSV